MDDDRWQIRQLGLSEYEAVMDVWSRSGLTSLKPKGRDSREAFVRQLEAGAQKILGVRSDSVLVGVVLTTHDGRKGWINRLAVLPEYRRMGLGARLVTAAEKTLQDQGITVIAALVEKENEGSFHLFQRLGYVEVDPGIHYLSKRENDLV